MKDEKIVELYLSRSENAIAETDKKYGACCRNTAYDILGNREDTEECVNDTYMKVWNVIPPQKPVKLGSFVLRIVRNLAVDMFRSRKSAKNGNGYNAVGYDEISEFLPSRETVEGVSSSPLTFRPLTETLLAADRSKPNILSAVTTMQA